MNARRRGLDGAGVRALLELLHELVGRDVHPVAQHLVLEDQVQRHQVHAVRAHHLVRQVAGGVGHHAHGAARQRHVPRRRALGHGVLGVHVLRLVRRQPAEAAQVAEHLLGLVGVHVHLEHVAAADDHQRVAALAQPGAHRVLRPAARRRAPAPRCRSGTAPRPRVVRLGRGEDDGLGVVLRRLVQRHQRVARQVAGDPLQDVDEALGARVHHAARLEHRQQLRRVGQRLARLDQQPLEQDHEVRVLQPLRLVGDGAHDGDHGPLDRLFQRLVHVLRGAAQHLPELRHAQPRPVADGVGEAQQEVREDHPAVAAGAHDPRVGGGARHARPARCRCCAAAGRRWSPTVSARLVPVSPSGTGKTLMRFRSARCRCTYSGGRDQRAAQAGAVQVCGIHAETVAFGGRGGQRAAATPGRRDRPVRAGERRGGSWKRPQPAP